MSDPERVAQKVELPFRDPANSCLLLVDRELQLAHDLAQLLQCLIGIALLAQDHKVSSAGEFHPRALAETDVRTLASSGSHCSAAPLQEAPVSEQIRLAARDALQPLL